MLVSGQNMLKNTPEAKRFKAITEFLFVKKGLNPKEHFDTSTVHRLASQSKDVKSAIKLTKSFFNKVFYFMNKGAKPNFRFILDILEQNPKVSSRHTFRLHNQFGNQLQALRKQFPKAEFSNERKTALLKVLVKANTMFNGRAAKAVKKSPLFKALMKENESNPMLEEAFKDIKAQQYKATNPNKVVEETIHFDEALGLKYVIEDSFAEYFSTFDTEESVWLNSMEDGNFWYEYGDAHYIYDVKTGESSLYEAEAVVEDISTESTGNKDIPLPLPSSPGKPPVFQERSIGEKKNVLVCSKKLNRVKS